MSASTANDGRVSWPLEHQNEITVRAALSPRSDSPMGPEPTREPRIALPVAIAGGPPRPGAARPSAPAPLSAFDLDEQPRADDRDQPDGTHEEGEAVEVLLDD